MKKRIIPLLLLPIIYSCNGQQNYKNTKKDTTMIERFDFEDYNRRIKQNPLGDIYTQEDGTKVMMTGGNEPFIYITPPPPSFILIVKIFYKNGIIKMKGKSIGELVNIGIWQYYDETGKLVKEVDEDKKFGKIKPEDILRFMEKEGFINLTTGAGRFDKSGDETFRLTFTPARNSSILGGEKISSKWHITFWPSQDNSYTQTDYEIDGETGKVISKKSEKVFMEE